MQRITVLLLFGGESSEHTVSISSARNVFAALDDTKYDVVLGYIDKTGKWWLLDNLSDQLDTSEAQQLLPVLGSGSFTTAIDRDIITPAVILPILHGANGEDGTVQGLARLLHIPIVGCDLAASAICMDKVVTKQLLEHNAIKTVPYAVHLSGEPLPSFGHLSAQLGSPLFVKPARSGSSVGVNKVKDDDELSTALSQAHQHDTKVLIEQAITARELEVGVLGSGRTARVSGIGEIKPAEINQAQVVIPADLSPELSELIRAIAARVYKVLGCEGLAQVNLLLSEDDILYVSHVDAIPGFTNVSAYPKLWRQQGFTYASLIDALIETALF